MKVLFALKDFWDNKGLFEKFFWVLFFTFIILFLFYIFNFENLEKYYFSIRQNPQSNLADSMMISDKQKLFYSPLEMVQQILKQSKILNIYNFNIFDNEITIAGQGDFDSVMELFHFIESYAQNFILDFYFYSASPFDFKIVFVSKGK
ncbi:MULTISPECIES: hypothetical protein [unclassified Helicobacter]|uniref:hypothetical protein n=1 Tax=unclassified Helicobacter TaxID=2593540 RepID=UPI000CF1B5C0|nr:MULTISPECIES: hypothetical protein [unclassified Helicobacter]